MFTINLGWYELHIRHEATFWLYFKNDFKYLCEKEAKKRNIKEEKKRLWQIRAKTEVGINAKKTI